MPHIDINLSEEEDHKIDLYKAINKLSSKEQAIKDIISKLALKVKKDGSLIIGDSK